MSIKLVFGVLIIYDNYAHRGIAKLIRHGILTPTFAGLSPATPAKIKFLLRILFLVFVLI